MASAECEPIMGVWGGAPNGVQGQSPWSGSQGVRGRSLPEAESVLSFQMTKEGEIWP